MLYLNYCLRARHRKGRGIHPPFAYRIVSEVIFGKGTAINGWGKIESYRQELRQNPLVIPVEDHGAGSRRRLDDRRRISDLVRHTAVTPRRGRLLSCLAAHLRPPLMVELGTGTGIGSLYLALGNPDGQVHTCEGSPAIARLAEKGFERLGVGNIMVHTGLFADLLPGLLNLDVAGMLMFIDGDHREESMVSYVSLALASAIPDLVIVMDDIHWSRGMFRAWKSVLRRPEITLSIELFNTGIVFAKDDIQKNHFTVIF